MQKKKQVIGVNSHADLADLTDNKVNFCDFCDLASPKAPTVGSAGNNRTILCEIKNPYNPCNPHANNKKQYTGVNSHADLADIADSIVSFCVR